MQSIIYNIWTSLLNILQYTRSPFQSEVNSITPKILCWYNRPIFTYHDHYTHYCATQPSKVWWTVKGSSCTHESLECLVCCNVETPRFSICMTRSFKITHIWCLELRYYFMLNASFCMHSQKCMSEHIFWRKGIKLDLIISFKTVHTKHIHIF